MKPFVSLLLLTLLPTHHYAQWSRDPANNLIVGYGLLPEICSDSAGGAYITYEVSSTYPRHIALRRLNRHGYQPWGSSRAIQGVKPESRYAALAADGRNGVFVAFLDREWNQNPKDPRYNDRVRVQRVDSSGTFLWSPAGIRLSMAEHTQSADAFPKIVEDGTGGCAVLWYDTLNGIRMQRLRGDGSRAWGDSGVLVETRQSIILHVVGNVLTGFIAYVGGGRFHRLDSNSTKLWGQNGVTLQTWSGLKVSDDRKAGVILSGTLLTTSGRNVMCQRLDSSGTARWSQNGIALAESLTNAPEIAQIVHLDGSSVFAWTRDVGGNLKTFAQRVRTNGISVFVERGIQVAPHSSSNGPWSLVTSSLTSTLFVLADARFGGSVVAQRVDSVGTRVWTDSGVIASLRHLGNVRNTTDKNGGAIVIGFDQSDFSVRGQQINVNGTLGEVTTSVHQVAQTPIQDFEVIQTYPNPFNNSTEDVPNAVEKNLS
jgi:hypothetical protein